MKRILAFLAAFVIGAIALRASADPDPLSYDDPGMHFKAPDGWKRVPIPADSSSPGLEEKKMLAAYTLTIDRNEGRFISIVASPFDGAVDAAESQQESDLRNGSDSTLVDHKTKITLANGMPAWFIHVSQSNDDPFKSTETYEYIVSDGSRMIVTAYAGRAASLSEDDAKKALSSLYVVLYPKHRP